MTSTDIKLLNVFAPAKVNLYLHITEKLSNGYHALDSLVAFVDIGDKIKIEPANELTFQITGPYAGSFKGTDLDCSKASSNLVIRAAFSLAKAANKTPDIKITLEKNLPLASGLGGGSADAAATIWGLCEWWKISKKSDYIHDILSELGADAPVCFQCLPARLKGIGDVFENAPIFSETPIVLVNPEKACPTPLVFERGTQDFKKIIELPSRLDNFDDLIVFLENTDNSLYQSACQIVPEIENIQRAIGLQAGCRLARMSGAGATCFGLFRTENQAQEAAKNIAYENPDWWVESGLLNRPERY